MKVNDIPYSSNLRAFAMVRDNSQIQAAYTSKHSFLHNATRERWIDCGSAQGCGLTLGWHLTFSSGAQTTKAVLTCNVQPCGRAQKHKAEPSHAIPLPTGCLEVACVPPTCWLHWPKQVTWPSPKGCVIGKEEVNT